jgi:hypothetical protein
VGIIEVEEAGGVVGHGVHGPRDVVAEREIAVKTLVQGMLSEDGRGGGCGGDGATASPVEGGKIIGAGLDGALPDVEALCCDVVVEIGADEFELGVVEVAVHIRKGAKPIGDLGGETSAPHDGGGGGGRGQANGNRAGRGGGHEGAQGYAAADGGGVGEPHATSARAGGVVGANKAGGTRDQLVEAGRATAEVGEEPPKVVQGMMKRGREAQARAHTSAKGRLQVAEQSAGAWKGQRHRAEFSKQSMPGIHG